MRFWVLFYQITNNVGIYKLKFFHISTLSLHVVYSLFKSNAQNRLISKFSKLFMLTNSVGCTLGYHQRPVESSEVLQSLKL